MRTNQKGRCISGKGFSVGLPGKGAGSEGHCTQAIIIISLVLYGDGEVSKLF